MSENGFDQIFSRWGINLGRIGLERKVIVGEHDVKSIPRPVYTAGLLQYAPKA